MKRRLWWGTGITLAAVIAVTVTASARSGTAKNAPSNEGREAIPVRVVSAEWISVADEQTYPALIDPRAQVDVAFQTAGLVTGLLQTHGRALESGDSVSRGEVLARLRRTEYQARVAAAAAQTDDARAARQTAEAQIAEAAAATTQSEADLRRAEALLRDQAMTRSEYDGVKARFDAAQARRSAAEASLRAASARVAQSEAADAESRVPLSDTVLTAPFSGFVLARRVERGATVAPGTVAYTLADLSSVKIAFGIPDAALSAFHGGTFVTVQADALPGRAFTGQVIAVAPATDPATRLFRVQAMVANPGTLLRAGMVANVRLAAPARQKVLAIPLSAVRRWKDHSAGFGVFVLNGEKIASVPVELGAAEGTLIAVKQGLAANDVVVRDATASLKTGDRVRIVP